MNKKNSIHNKLKIINTESYVREMPNYLLSMNRIQVKFSDLTKSFFIARTKGKIQCMRAWTIKDIYS